MRDAGFEGRNSESGAERAAATADQTTEQNRDSGTFNPPTSQLAPLGLLLAVLAAALVRMWGLDECPPGLFRDEAEKGYNAWALARTGGALDFSGGARLGPPVVWHPLPWMIDVMGGSTSAIYQYASGPIMWIAGLSVTTTRLTSAIIGTLTVALLGWLMMRAWGAWLGATAAIWLALMPWHLVFSRWALEGIFVPCFLVLALMGIWGFAHQGRRWGLALAGGALGWLFYSYSGAQPFVLAWGLCLLIIYRKRIEPRRWPFWLALALFLLPVIPTLWVRLAPGGSSRLARIAIWSEPGITYGKIIWNIIKNYFAHFDPRFLFLSGDTQPRHGIPGLGQLLIVDIVLLPLGLWMALRHRRSLAGALVAALLCAPLPAAITREGIPHALRTIGMTVPAASFSALGMVTALCWLMNQVRQRGVSAARQRMMIGELVIALLLVGLNGVLAYRRACRNEPIMLVAFEAGERQAWETIAANRQPGQRVFVNGHIPYAPYFQLFFTQPDPKQFARQKPGADGFIYFDPERMSPSLIEEQMAVGDWLIMAARPDQVSASPEGEPLLTSEEVHRTREFWVWAVQKR